MASNEFRIPWAGSPQTWLRLVVRDGQYWAHLDVPNVNHSRGLSSSQPGAFSPACTFAARRLLIQLYLWSLTCGNFYNESLSFRGSFTSEDSQLYQLLRLESLTCENTADRKWSYSTAYGTVRALTYVGSLHSVSFREITINYFTYLCLHMPLVIYGISKWSKLCSFKKVSEQNGKLSVSPPRRFIHEYWN